MFDKKALQAEMLSVLQDNILSFWLDRMVDSERGGFYGRIGGDGAVDADAPKGRYSTPAYCGPFRPHTA